MIIPRREGEGEDRPVRRVEAVDTLRLRGGSAPAASMRDFYGRVLGLDEEHSAEGLLVYQVEKRAIEIRWEPEPTGRESADAGDAPSLHRRMTLEVRGIYDVMGRLREEKIGFEVRHEVGHPAPRVTVKDPVGHRLLLKQVRQM